MFGSNSTTLTVSCVHLHTVEQCPPELAARYFERGMVLTGGGALMKNIDILLAKESGVPVIVAG